MSEATVPVRFGARVRQWLANLRPHNPAWSTLQDVAELIDQDAAAVVTAAIDESVRASAQQLVNEARRTDRQALRRRVEEAVERLKQDQIEGEPTEDEWVRASLLLAELAAIFGER